MKECKECGKKLGIIEGYRHPTMGKDCLLCSNCFDTVTESVEKWSEIISLYNGFFNMDSQKNDNRSISKDVIKKIQKRISNPWSS
jgi:transcription elongation factor Elf1